MPDDAVYDIAYELESSHHHAVELIRAALTPQEGGSAPAVVLDIGCGYGPHADSVRELGLDYVGLDIDPAGLGHLATRGFQTGQLDLSDIDAIAPTLTAALAGRQLRFVMMLDVLEHLLDPAAVLAAVRSVLAPGAEIVVSLPNVAHVDVALQLLHGRFEPTPSGLLDETHLRWFSGTGVANLLATAGFRVTARHDVVVSRSELANPVDDPLLGRDTPVNQFLVDLRSRTAPEATTYQFVFRAVPGPSAPPSRPPFPTPNPSEGLTVAVGAGWTDQQRQHLVADVAAIPGAELRQVGDAGFGPTVADHLDLRTLADHARRWTMVVSPGTRLDASLGDRLLGHSRDSSGHLVRFGARTAAGTHLTQSTLDPSRDDWFGVLAPSSFAVPSLVVAALWPPTVGPGGHDHIIEVMRAVSTAGLVIDDQTLVVVTESDILDEIAAEKLHIASAASTPVLLAGGSLEHLAEQAARLRRRDAEVGKLSAKAAEVDLLHATKDAQVRDIAALRMRVADLENRTTALIEHNEAIGRRRSVRYADAVGRLVRRLRAIIS